MDDHPRDLAREVPALVADVERRVTPPPFDALRARHRRRQQRRRGAAATLSLVVVAAGAGLYLRESPNGLPRQNDTLLAAQLATSDQKVPPADFTFTVTDVEFVDARIGWVIGLACEGDTCSVATRRTPDAGSTWEPAVVVNDAVPRALLRSQDPASAGVRSLRFVNERDGYAFNPDLYVTHDGGLTWARDPQRGKVVNVHAGGAAGDDAVPWRLQRPCGTGERCEFVVTNAPSSPPAVGTDAMLRRVGPRDAWVIAWDNVTGDGSLHVTRDGGRNWSDGTDPCPGVRLRTAAAAPDGVLWAACPAPDGRVARSTDGGATWTYATPDDFPGTPTELEPLSGSTAYLATTDRGRLLVTNDGGATWRMAPGTKAGFSYSNIQFVDAVHGFAMGDAGDLWRTTDGVTWSRLRLPS